MHAVAHTFNNSFLGACTIQGDNGKCYEIGLQCVKTDVFTRKKRQVFYQGEGIVCCTGKGRHLLLPVRYKADRNHALRQMPKHAWTDMRVPTPLVWYSAGVPIGARQEGWQS